MRPFYFFLYIVLNYVLRVVFTQVGRRNAPRKRRNTTIVVSNHPSAFMDPLVIACLQRSIVFFMTRSDVFKPLLKPILASANMLPIYRQMDGEGAVKKNKAVFRECYKILETDRSPLLFGEGLTDDVFERRLKHLRKGAARIAFGAMEFHNWNLDLKIHCIGLNYEDPTQFRSGVAISNAPLIDIKSYKASYLENEAKAVNQLTNDIENAIRNEITNVVDNDDFEIHEQVMRLTLKGMHFVDHDKSIDILERQAYSKKLADTINLYSEKSNASFNELKNNLASYFNKLSSQKIENSFVHEMAKEGKLSNIKNLAFLLLLWPVAILGWLLMGIPYLLTKRFVESTFKRKVFWLSIKMVMGLFVGAMFSIGSSIMFYHLIFSNIWITILFFFTVPTFSFIIAYEYRKRRKNFFSKKKAMTFDLSELVKERAELLQQIDDTFPNL